jgi:hypothetical protein
MIVLQSSAIVESANHLAHRSPSPGGEETGEGELNCRSGRQPALIEVGVCPSGTFENSQQHARVIHGWVHRLPKTKSPGRTSEIRVYRCPSVVKLVVLPSQIIEPLQGCANLGKAMQAHPPREGGREVSLRVQSCTPVTPIIAYLRLLAPIDGVFPEKKDCLFFVGWRLGLSSLRRESTQINPSMTKYRPHTGPYRPKMNNNCLLGPWNLELLRSLDVGVWMSFPSYFLLANGLSIGFTIPLYIYVYRHIYRHRHSL